MLDECLYLRKEIRDLLTSIKINASTIKLPEIKNSVLTSVNNYFNRVRVIDQKLRSLHDLINPEGVHLTIRDHLQGDNNPYAFTYQPRGGNLASLVFPFLHH